MLRTTSRLAILGLVVVLLAAGPVAAQFQTVTIDNAGPALGETPLLVPLQGALPEAGIYALEPLQGGNPVRAEVFEDGGRTYVCAILDAIPPGRTAYQVSGLIRIKGTPSVQMQAKEGNVEVFLGKDLFTELINDVGPKPFLFPLIGPTGAPITRAYPMKDVPGEDHDHPHQRSFWFTHGKVNGVDFWSEEKGHGTIRQTSRPNMRSGWTVGLIRTTDDWLSADGKKVCEDERLLRVYATKTSRILDFDVKLKATEGPVTFGDTKEGMFGVRVASTMDVKRKIGGKITNAEGLTDLAAWGQASAWVDYVGPVENSTVGIAILNHPSSFRYPTTWHVRDYGLFAANPFGWKDFGQKESGDFTIPPHGEINFGYRVILHKGSTAEAKLPDAFRAYGTPPRVEFK